MDKEIIFLVEEDPVDGGFIARALGHSIFTQAENLETLKEMVQDAVCCHFEADAKPPVTRLHIVRDEVIPA